jgi:hypothetical protein
VGTFLSSNNLNPDIAVETFLLDEQRSRTASDSDPVLRL